MYSLLQRLRSLRHRFWYGVSEGVGWSRGIVHEIPAGEMQGLTPDESKRIAALRIRYQVSFESRMSSVTARNNYEYLDILERGFGGEAPIKGGVLCDVGCASFWYAAALDVFFKPRRMVGIEVEGHRLFRGGHTRIDHAAGYLSHLPNATFEVADYCSVTMPADLITAWFPFVTGNAILAWRLPLSLLTPGQMFEGVRRNLKPGGTFVMVNHGNAEAEIAQRLCIAAGLQQSSSFGGPGPLSVHRLEPAIFSTWQLR